MKKLILKTALITLAAAIVVSVALCGLVAACAPDVMMEFTASMGMTSASGDCAYSAYKRTNDVDYLGRSFVIAAEAGNDKKADARFDILYEHENFNAFCLSGNEIMTVKTSEGETRFYCEYRGYVCGLGARVKYNLGTSESKAAAIELAIQETKTDFPKYGNPVIMLASKAASANDKQFCSQLLAVVKTAGFEENTDYKFIVEILEGVAS